MQNTFTKSLILSLIKDDLTNAKLVNGLREVGLDASDYTLHLSETIFQLMGLENTLENDAVFDHYFKLSQQVKFIHLAHHPEPLEKLAQDVYDYLELVKDS